MEQKTFPAFGYVVVKNTFPAGHVMNDGEIFLNGYFTVTNPSPYADGKFGPPQGGYQWLYISGCVQHTNVETQEVQQRTRGFCNLDTSERIGTFKVEYLEDSVVYCTSPVLNKDKFPVSPNTTCFRLPQGQTTTLAQNTKLFLVDGIIEVSELQITGPRQVHVRVESGPRQVTAVSDCLGYIFE